MEKIWNIVIIVLLVLCVIWMLLPRAEYFDRTTREFVPVGHPRYGLRGDLLNTVSIEDSFYPYDRKIRLSHSNADMYQSFNVPSHVYGTDMACKTTKCPSGDGYDASDTCYVCGDQELQPMVIPDIHPHV